MARDRFGEKPLYYGWTGNGSELAFIFGSELKALRAYPRFDNQINRGALALFLKYSTVPAPHSIYENVFKLQPGKILTLRVENMVNRLIKIDSYWSLTDFVRQGYG